MSAQLFTFHLFTQTKYMGPNQGLGGALWGHQEGKGREQQGTLEPCSMPSDGPITRQATLTPGSGGSRGGPGPQLPALRR